MKFDDLLAKDESPKLDFKAIWKPADLKGELIKDILSIANGNPQKVGEAGYLVFGVSDDKQKFNNIDDAMLGIPRPHADLATLEGKILEALNNAATPAFLGLKLEFMNTDGKRILVITIPPHPYLFSLSKDLQLKKRTDKKNTVYFRIGEQINIASPDVIDAFKKKMGDSKAENGQKALIKNSLEDIEGSNISIADKKPHISNSMNNIKNSTISIGE